MTILHSSPALRDDPEARNSPAGTEGDGVDLYPAAAVLAAAQELRRSVSRGSTPSAELLSSLEATLDSIGVSITELRGPLLQAVVSGRGTHPGARTAQLDAARLVGEANQHLAQAASACGALRTLLDATARPSRAGSRSG